MSEVQEVHLSSVTKESGEILFIYADKYSVYVLYRPDRRKQLYLAVCDKRLYIERVDVLEVPEWFFEYSTVRFFKPKNQDEISFPGVVTVGETITRFEMYQNGEVEFTDELGSFDLAVKQTALLLPVLETFDVVNGIQHREKFYFVGIDKQDLDNQHPVYGVVDMVGGNLETVYYLYSDKGEVVPSCVTIDVHERFVYVAGKTIVFDQNDSVIDHIPYIEQFMLRV